MAFSLVLNQDPEAYIGEQNNDVPQKRCIITISMDASSISSYEDISKDCKGMTCSCAAI